MALTEDADWLQHEFRRVEERFAQASEQQLRSTTTEEAELLSYVQPERSRHGNRTRRTFAVVAAACLILALIAGMSRLRPNEARSASVTQTATMIWAVSDQFENFEAASMAIESDTYWDSTYCVESCRNAAFSIRVFKNGTFPDESPATFGTKTGTHTIAMPDGSTLSGDVRVLPSTVESHTYEVSLLGDLRFEVYARGFTAEQFVDLLGTVHVVTEELWKARAALATARRVVTGPAVPVGQPGSVTGPSTSLSSSLSPAKSAASEPKMPELKEINVSAAVQDFVRDGSSGRRFSGLIAKCSGVERAGPPDLPASEGQRTVENVLFLNRGRIATRGYHMLTDSPSVLGDAGGSPSAQDQEVARCGTALVSALASIAEPDYNPAASANVEILKASSTAVELADQRAAWTQCMAAAGFRVAVRGESITEFLRSVDPTEPERAQALADFDCHGSSGLREGKQQWLASQVTAWLAKNRSWVDSLGSSRAAYEDKLAELERNGWRGQM
jgi:hypothetical protein